MSDWNSTQYMKFASERTQPSIDLINRLDGIAPARPSGSVILKMPRLFFTAVK